MTKKKMGSLGKLSQFSGIKLQEEEPPAPEPTPLPQSAAVEPNVGELPPVSPPKEKLVTINIKITRVQQEWLTDTARQVRENNLDPVPPAERVFPQHLIGVAVDLLRKAEVDWSQVRNVEELRKWLNL
ncbi:MAG TPA: hypothetical protein V6D30_18710 [Leptolyngbyaceae cyanobacterium]